MATPGKRPPTPAESLFLPQKSSSPLRVVLLALVVVVVLVGGGLAAVSFTKKQLAAPEYPAAWDPAVLPYVRIVEKQRGLTFEHPIYVDFLDDAAFKQQLLGSGDDEPSADDTAAIDATSAQLQSLGLVGTDVDLLKQSTKLYGASVIGFYSFVDHRIRVRGVPTLLSTSAQSTLIHELTHALQDQHFDIGARAEAYADSDDPEDAVLSSTFQAVYEGDAVDVETRWAKTLDATQRRYLMQQQEQDSKRARAGSAGVPPVLATSLSAPYELGQGLVALARQLGGTKAVNELEEHPPTSDEQVLDPWTLLREHDRPKPVAVPKTAPGEKQLDSGTFGAIGWYITLAERLPAHEVLRAVDGWGGDAYSVIRRQDHGHDQSCIRISYVADTPTDLAQMRGALQDWVGAGPPRTAIVTPSAKGLVLSACAKRGVKIPAPVTQGDLIGLLAERTAVTAAVLENGHTTPETARCYAQKVADRYLPEQLAGVSPTTFQALAATC